MPAPEAGTLTTSTTHRRTDMTQQTTTIRAWGQSSQAYAEHDGHTIVVRVWDEIAGHYTVCHSLTPAQMQRVIGLTLRK